MHCKIYIIGSVGSGKTTLAKSMSERLKIPWYELDNIIWERHLDGDIKRNPEARDSLYNSITDSEKWIVEGTYRQCFNNIFDRADAIIVLDTPPFKRKYRIAKRWVKQKLKLEKSNYKPTVKMLLCMYKWSKGYEKSKRSFMDMLEPYMSKVFTINDDKGVEFFYEYTR